MCTWPWNTGKGKIQNKCFTLACFYWFIWSLEIDEYKTKWTKITKQIIELYQSVFQNRSTISRLVYLVYVLFLHCKYVCIDPRIHAFQADIQITGQQHFPFFLREMYGRRFTENRVNLPPSGSSIKFSSSSTETYFFYFPTFPVCGFLV